MNKNGKEAKKLTPDVYKEITSSKEGKEHFDKAINDQLDDLMQKMLEEDD